MASTKRFYGREKNKLKFSKHGKPLCRFCEKEVKPPRRTFCSDACVHEWKLRKSSSYVRACLFKRDKGICSICGMDTYTLRKQGRKMVLSDYKMFAKSLGMPYKRTTWWDADHIIPVVEGGGECGLENYRTLCCKCHKKVTKELTGRLSRKRRFDKHVKKGKKGIPLPPIETEDPQTYYLWQTGKLRV